MRPTSAPRNTNKRHRLLSASVICLIAGGCANYPQKVSDQQAMPGQQANNAAAKAVDAHNFVEVDFSRASATLTDRAISSIEAGLRQAKQQGDISEIIIMSWSDEEYPSEKRNRLSQDQIALAERRNQAVKRYLSFLKNTDVDTYNMSERPNAISKWFNTTDTKLKNSLMAAGLPTTGSEGKYPTKASHAVILIKVE